jgi:hypothetical protein
MQKSSSSPVKMWIAGALLFVGAAAAIGLFAMALHGAEKPALTVTVPEKIGAAPSTLHVDAQAPLWGLSVVTVSINGAKRRRTHQRRFSDSPAGQRRQHRHCRHGDRPRDAAAAGRHRKNRAHRRR